MSDLYWLDQIQPEQHPLVGDKALQLSYLVQQGYPAIPGFVVSAQKFREFLATINWLEPLFADLASSSLYLNVDNARQLQVVACQIRQTIAATPLPSSWIEGLAGAMHQLGGLGSVSRGDALILRPSMTIQPSVVHQLSLPIPLGAMSLLEFQTGWADAESLEIGLKQVWSELFRARNLFYWQRSRISLHQVNLAVLVQPLSSAIASGSLRVHANGFEVRAIEGLSMAIDRGEVNPDVYQIDAKSNKVQAQQLSSKTIAYRVQSREAVSASESTLPDGHLSNAASPLQTYLLPDQQTRQPVLSSVDLAQLGHLAQRLLKEFDTSLDLAWVLHPASPTENQVLFTQLSFISPLTIERAILPPNLTGTVSEGSKQFTVAGLAAAPGQVIARATVITSNQPPFLIPPQTILVAPNFTPDWLPMLKQVAGVVAEQGGMTSHGAIIARELGIPAVVGAVGATQQIATGDWLSLDGYQGQVYRVEAPEMSDLTVVSGSSPSLNNQTAIVHPLPESAWVVQSSPTLTQLMVSISQPDALDRAARLPVDGIGLLRSELMMLPLLDQQHPTQWLKTGRRAELVERWAAQIRLFAQRFAPRPVFYRSLDLRSHEFQTLQGSEQRSESPPMLGVRGTFSYQLDPELFDVELSALSQVCQAGSTNLRLLLPFVRTVEEFVFCRQRLELAGLTQLPDFQLWIMAEVPSVLFLLPDYVAAGVQGIAIGTNDLTQLLLGVDRDQSIMATAFNEAHPAVLKAIAQLIQTAQTLGIPCSICGQAPVHHPELIDDLIRLGVTAISVSLDAVPSTLQAILQAEHRLKRGERR